MLSLSRRSSRLPFGAAVARCLCCLAVVLGVVAALFARQPVYLASAQDVATPGRPGEAMPSYPGDWNTFFGSSTEDDARGVARFGDNAVYYVGTSYSTWGNPIRPFIGGGDAEYPASDAYVVKTDNAGNIIWNTFLGGDARDAAYAVAVDGAGNVYVYGFSGLGWGTPLSTHTVASDVFVARLNPAGQLIWLRFLGDNGEQYGEDMVVDSDGNAYVAGYSRASWGTPIRPFTDSFPPLDGFVAALAPDGALRWNTFLGGDGADNSAGIGLYTGSVGIPRLYVTGNSSAPWGYETEYPNTSRVYIAFLRLDGELVYNRFVKFPEGYDDYSEVAVNVNDLDVDAAGHPIVVGEIWFRDKVDINTVYCDGYLARTDSTLALEWSLTFTGTVQGPIEEVLVLPSGDIATAGSTSCGLETPVSAPIGKNDGLLMILDRNGNVFSRTYVGGPENDLLTSVAPVDGTHLLLGGLSQASWGTPIRPFAADWDGFGALQTVDVPDRLYLPQVTRPPR